VDAQRETLEFDQKMLAPAAQRHDALTDQPRLVDLGIALGAQDFPAGEAGGLFLENEDGRPFGHGALLSSNASESTEAAWSILQLTWCSLRCITQPIQGCACSQS
jgi:hypothetical protein